VADPSIGALSFPIPSAAALITSSQFPWAAQTASTIFCRRILVATSLEAIASWTCIEPTALSEKELRIVVMHGTPVQFGPKYYQPVVEGFSRKRFALWHVWKAIKYPVLAVFAIAMIPVAWYGGLFALRLIATLGYVAPQVFWALVIVCVWLLTRRGQRRGRSARARRAAATRRRNAEYDRLRDGLSAKARRSASVDPSQMPKQLTDVSGYLSKCVIAWTELTDIPETFLVPGSGVAKRLEA
jgi:hypothetical protein